ncbi:MAG TPA: plastocyanin/azurin family copper-binding protein [Acidimicrobiales bacterium]
MRRRPVAAGAAAAVVAAGALVAGALVAGFGAGSAGSASGSEGGGMLGPGVVQVDVGIEHSRFSVDRIRVRRGTTVEFLVGNADPIHHELIVGDDDVHRRHATGKEASHPPVPGEVSVPPKAKASTSFTFDRAGTFRFACHLPGHLAYGMEGEVVVVDA